MNAATLHETEVVTRSVARWGSVAAALVFGGTFLIDPKRTFALGPEHWVQVALLAAVFAGYALAWRERLETLGSLISIAATVAYCLYCKSLDAYVPVAWTTVVAAPAVFHLMAVAFHRQQTETAAHA